MTDYYISQSGAGSATGADFANRAAVGDLSTLLNTTMAGQDRLFICGDLTISGNIVLSSSSLSGHNNTSQKTVIRGNSATVDNTREEVTLTHTAGSGHLIEITTTINHVLVQDVVFDDAYETCWKVTGSAVTPGEWEFQRCKFTNAGRGGTGSGYEGTHDNSIFRECEFGNNADYGFDCPQLNRGNTITFFNCSFHDNTTGYRGNHTLNNQFFECMFYRNDIAWAADRYGFMGNLIKNCIFDDNTVVFDWDFKAGWIGLHRMEIYNSIFNNNTTVFQTDTDSSMNLNDGFEGFDPIIEGNVFTGNTAMYNFTGSVPDSWTVSDYGTNDETGLNPGFTLASSGSNTPDYTLTSSTELHQAGYAPARSN